MPRPKKGQTELSGFKNNFPDIKTFDEIIMRMSNGEALTRICREPNMPHFSVVMDWVNRNAELFDRYARAKQCQADFYADDIVDIADNDSNIARARNRMDARRWHAAKIAPKKYGDRVLTELSGQVNQSIKLDLSNMTPETRAQLKQTLLEQLRKAPVTIEHKSNKASK